MKDFSIDTALRSAPVGVATGEARLESLRARQVEAAAKRFEDRTAAREHADRLKQNGLFLAVDDPDRIAARAARKIGRPEQKEALIGKVVAEADKPAPTLAAAMERIIGSNDLLPISYFEKGMLSAQAVGRVVTTNEQQRVVSYGTAFLVAPGIVLTNHHVLPDAETAALSRVEFNYQMGLDNQMQHIDAARIDATRYLSDEHLDFALAGLVGGSADAARPVLPLIASTAKIINGESVSIIQHPGAAPKQVAVRDNKIIDLLPDFVHYATDTDSGSSGSPVMSDQWEVVALHHAGVPGVDAGGNSTWVANEGIRISRIVAHLRGLTNLPAPVKQMVASVLAPPATPEASPVKSPAKFAAGSSAGSSAESLAESFAKSDAKSPAKSPANLLADISQLRQAANESASAAPHLKLSTGAYVTEINISIRPGDGAAAPFADGGVAPHERTLARGAALDVGTALTGGMNEVATGVARPESETLVEQLEAGDILLYSGTGLLSQAIKFFTNSDVSHAGLFLGGPGGGMIGEALDNGVIQDTREQSFQGHNWVLAYRLRSTQHLAPVIARANFYLGQGLKYAYPQLVFLAILLLVKRVRPSGILGRMVSAVATAAAEALNRFVESGRDLMICSEFVYRTFDEAASGPANPYRLQLPASAIESRSARGMVEPGSILSQLQAHPELAESGFQQAAESARAALVLNQPVLEAQANSLVAEYLAEQQYGRPSRKVVDQFVVDQQTATAVSRFAIALATLQHRVNGANNEAARESALQGRQADALPLALDALMRTPADFVTPADLKLSPSLVMVGRVY